MKSLRAILPISGLLLLMGVADTVHADDFGFGIRFGPFSVGRYGRHWHGGYRSRHGHFGYHPYWPYYSGRWDPWWDGAYYTRRDPPGRREAKPPRFEGAESNLRTVEDKRILKAASRRPDDSMQQRAVANRDRLGQRAPPFENERRPQTVDDLSETPDAPTKEADDE